MSQQTTRFETIKRTINRRKATSRDRPLPISVLQSRLDQLQQYWKEAHDAHVDIMGTPDSETDPYVTESQFENMEIECETETDELAMLIHELSAEPPQPPTTGPLSNKIRLPKATPPQFSGKYEDWGNFTDMFLSMIDEDQTLPNVVKLQYLKQCLTGEAAEFVKDVKVEDANYKPTWEALKKRYCNVRLLIH